MISQKLDQTLLLHRLARLPRLPPALRLNFRTLTTVGRPEVQKTSRDGHKKARSLPRPWPTKGLGQTPSRAGAITRPHSRPCNNELRGAVTDWQRCSTRSGRSSNHATVGKTPDEELEVGAIRAAPIMGIAAISWLVQPYRSRRRCM